MPKPDAQKLASSLVGTDVRIIISEPWEFCTDVGTEPFLGTIEQALVRVHANPEGVETEEGVLIRLHKPFAYKNVKCEFLVASPRNEGADLLSFVHGKNLSFNFQRVPTMIGLSNNPFDPETWRGNPEMFGLIGSMEKIEL